MRRQKYSSPIIEGESTTIKLLQAAVLSFETQIIVSQTIQSELLNKVEDKIEKIEFQKKMNQKHFVRVFILYSGPYYSIL